MMDQNKSVLDITDPEVKIRCGISNKGWCTVCREQSKYGIYLEIDRKLVGRACAFHRQQLIAIRGSRRRDRYGVATGDRGLGPEGMSACAAVKDSALSPAFVSGGREIYLPAKRH